MSRDTSQCKGPEVRVDLGVFKHARGLGKDYEREGHSVSWLWVHVSV